MPPVMFLAVVGFAGVAAYRFLSAIGRGAHSGARKDDAGMKRAPAPVRDLGNLDWDEASGVYRPRQQREN
ncbi:MAG: hypothetical protein ABWX70_05325 [Hyphomicrobium sp.]